MCPFQAALQLIEDKKQAEADEKQKIVDAKNAEKTKEADAKAAKIAKEAEDHLKQERRDQQLARESHIYNTYSARWLIN